jgi:hypothetical protein
MQSPKMNSQSKPFIATIVDYFTVRPFRSQKFSNSIQIDFYMVSSQDLQANLPVVEFALLFFVACIYGLFSMAYHLPSMGVDNQSQDEKIFIILSSLIFQVVPYSLIPFFIWKRLLRLIFARRILDFNAERLEVGEIIFGRYRRLFSIDSSELLPLQKKEKKIVSPPRILNLSLMVCVKGRYIELAGDLVIGAIAIVEEVYDRYGSSAYSEFYVETNPICLL